MKPAKFNGFYSPDIIFRSSSNNSDLLERKKERIPWGFVVGKLGSISRQIESNGSLVQLEIKSHATFRRVFSGQGWKRLLYWVKIQRQLSTVISPIFVTISSKVGLSRGSLDQQAVCNSCRAGGAALWAFQTRLLVLSWAMTESSFSLLKGNSPWWKTSQTRQENE